jgi:hypothetical protein
MFKKLAAIIVWILFVSGCLAILMGLQILPFFSSYWAYLPVGIAGMVLAVVVMRIRKEL